MIRAFFDIDTFHHAAYWAAAVQCRHAGPVTAAVTGPHAKLDDLSKSLRKECARIFSENSLHRPGIPASEECFHLVD